MKKRKNFIILISILFIILASLVTTFILNRREKETTLTILDKQWIENNKDRVTDIAILNNLPIFGYEGNGVFFQFIDDIQKNTGLEFNKVPYVTGSNPSLGEYVFKVLGTNIKPNNNQILVYEDKYVVISKNNNKIDTIKDFNGYTIGVLNDDISAVSYFLTDGQNLTFKTYDINTNLFNGLNNNEVSLIVIPYNLYLNNLLSNNSYNIVFHLNDVSKNYVLELSSKNSKLNSIVKKYYTKWANDNYKTIYNQSLFNLYLVDKNIDAKTKNDFQSKIYTYGLVEYLPYEMLLDNKLIGINGEYINMFSQVTGVEFKFIQYKNINDLNKAIAAGKVDISFNYYNTVANNNLIKTISPYNEEYVLLGNDNQNITINSLKSVKNNIVSVLKDTLLTDYLKTNQGLKIHEYDTMNKLLDNLNNNDLILIDSDVYDYYHDIKFNNYKVLYRGKLNNNYTFLINNNGNNKVFGDMFNTFVSSINYQGVKNAAMIKLLNNPIRQDLLQLLSKYVLLLIIIAFLFAKFSVGLFRKSKNQRQLKKEDKLRYTDMLTALKNRNYLNDHIDKWEENKIYPQAVIVVDLNNVKYINDNYGHEEGDNLIKKAASILINTQLENSEIMRTDGNEFLIYLIGYSEQQVVAYTRKLYKELKNLPHEFGAALGFSMIEDEIKLIDDAINEATLDMRTNKEGQRE